MTDMNSMFAGDRSLHEVLQEHLQECGQCKAAIEKAKPTGLGQHSDFCADYQFIISLWSEREGKVNNVVAHDEYGNPAGNGASGTVWR